MKRFLLSIFLWIAGIACNAQTASFEWANQTGGIGVDGAHTVTTDLAGNVYITGSFGETVDFDPGPGTVNLVSGYQDIFIQKLDPSGNLIWVKQIGAGIGTSIITDTLWNVYLTGHFNGVVDFDPGIGVTSLTSNGDADAFIQKLDSSGNLIWVKQMGGVETEAGLSVKTDDAGNVYSIGHFEETVDFDPGAGVTNLTSNGQQDVYIQKLDSSGNFMWVKQIGGMTLDIGRSIALDTSANVYTSGGFQWTADFDTGAGSYDMTSNGSMDIFIQKLDSSGNFIWAKQMGGVMYDSGQSVFTDNSGNIYSTGFFRSTVDFDPGAGVTNMTSSGGSDVYVQKLDPSGNFIWVRKVGGANNDVSASISVNPSGIYLIGGFNTTVDFDPGPGVTNLVSNGGQDIYIQKLDSLGNLIWVKQIGGADSDQGSSLTVDVFDNIYSTGNFMTTVDFNPDAGVTNFTSAGSVDMYVQKLNQCLPTTLIPDVAGLPDHTAGCTVVVPTATNNCGLVFTGTSDVTFPITDPLITSIIWTYEDGYGNSITQTQNVVATDNLAPLPDIAALLDFTSACAIVSISAPTATDNCAGIISGIPDVTFPITVLGVTSVTWTYDDGNGNTSTQTQNVIVTDNIAPVTDIASLPDIIDCSAVSPAAPTATDNCAGPITGVPDVTFPITTPGTTLVTWTYQDGNGNSTTQSQNMIVGDNTTPLAELVSLPDITGECSVASPATPTAMDNCEGVISGVADISFPVTLPGVTVVTWTYTDGAGNSSTQLQNIFVSDNSSPVADLLSLPDLTGICSIDAPVNPTAMDNCAGVITGTANVSFPITDQNISIINWTYDDGNGNTTTQSQNIVWENMDVTTVLSGITITANASPATYNWLDCNNSHLPVGVTAQNFVPTADGSYAVEITQNGCTDTSACVQIMGVGLENSSEYILKLYPNPTSGMLYVEGISDLEGFEKMTVVTVTGSEILTYKTKEQILDLSELAAGVYFVKITHSGLVSFERIVKE